MSKVNEATICRGASPIATSDAEVRGVWVELGSERFYRIANADRMPPFLMSLVSDSDHWLFVSSNGGLTAGRSDSDNALFPYCTEDKIEDNATNTGSRTIIWAERNGCRYVWEPFSKAGRGLYDTTTNLYKNVVGNKLVFEEVNRDLGLEFRSQWTMSDRFGFVKRSEIANTSASAVNLSVLDGVENLLPWGAAEAFHTRFSCLGDAYKQNELDERSGLGIYAFTSIPGDSPEPHEALRATVCWSTCPAGVPRLISSAQLDLFRHGEAIRSESRICGRRGAYFVYDSATIEAGKKAEWKIVADVSQGHVEIAELRRLLSSDSDLGRLVDEDIDEGTRNLRSIVASADGLQLTGDSLGSAHHFSNVLFNVMRGGTFEASHRIPVGDLADVVRSCNRGVAERHGGFFASQGVEVDARRLLDEARRQNDPHLVRIISEYLPLSFSRRHGDPSRPWNRFSIEVKGRNGRRVLGYEGNWRDIFQNWEALCHSFPEFIENVICKFVNTSTADGYNPYRITKKGYEWEVPNPDEPWSNIGYWGDHQLVYLLKLLEMSHDYHPRRLHRLLTDDIFVYADVPYDIAPYADLLRDPKKSIDYNIERERAISERERSLGLDGRYVTDRSGEICRANLAEKLLVPLLAKVSNFIPGAGFWMNTQRPEWNDANNALAGFGVSMVTLCHARRYVSFLAELIADAGLGEVVLNEEVGEWLDAVTEALENSRDLLAADDIDDSDRKRLLDALGAAAEAHRKAIYEHGFCGRRSAVAVEDLSAFLGLLLQYLDQTIELNRRTDGLYHSYNVMTANPGGISIARLQEMLEGQVAVLSAGCLGPDACVSVLEALHRSGMYREDQHSYTLYPNKRLPGFLEKNTLPKDRVERSRLIRRLLADGNTDLVEEDVDGQLHFNSTFQNDRDVAAALESLAAAGYADLVREDQELIADMYESVFRHREFTGRSGTFYGYEGLGCIYWHMVGKLLLAVQECCLSARGVDDVARQRLVAWYYDIRAGLGFNKPPGTHGAFPIDPYSHTPGDGGARQPGMTGQVKEEILTRRAELGLFVRNGRFCFDPVLLRRDEFLQQKETFEYFDASGELRTLQLESDTLAFTSCQTVFVVHLDSDERVVVRFSDGREETLRDSRLGFETSREIFLRTGRVARVDVFVDAERIVGDLPTSAGGAEPPPAGGDGS
jgi:hypothetical protein